MKKTLIIALSLLTFSTSSFALFKKEDGNKYSIEVLDRVEIKDSIITFFCSSGYVFLMNEMYAGSHRPGSVIQVFDDNEKPLTCEEFKKRQK